jgi:hypothetical protein
MNAYINYLDRHFKLKSINLKYELEIRQAQLLDYIAHCNVKDVPVNVTSLLAVKELGSPATIHNRLSQLVNGGFIASSPLPNSRAKFLRLDKKGKLRAQEINRLMKSA